MFPDLNNWVSGSSRLEMETITGGTYLCVGRERGGKNQNSSLAQTGSEMPVRHPSGNVRNAARHLLWNPKEKSPLETFTSGQHMEVVFGTMIMDDIQRETVGRASRTGSSRSSNI